MDKIIISDPFIKYLTRIAPYFCKAPLRVFVLVILPALTLFCFHLLKTTIKAGAVLITAFN